jgi:uncharacterized repeat protein (TIGR03803 family)
MGVLSAFHSQCFHLKGNFMHRQRSSPVKSFSPLTLAVTVLVLAVTFTTTARAQTYSSIYEFGGKTGDPDHPQYSGTITQGRDGELYTTTPDGGSNAYWGTAFKIAPSGALTVLYNFNATTGSSTAPFGGLTLGTDGNFYGTTQIGGSFSFGTVFKITAG